MNIYHLLPLLGLLLMIETACADPDTAPRRQLLITNFTQASAELGWYVVNDNVMGGRSEGDFTVTPELLRFAGQTNTDGGGFSSIRTGNLNLDLARYDGIRVRVKGDGRRYTWRLATDARVRGQPVGYWANFDTKSAAWITADIPFSSFAPKFRGTELDGPALETRHIRGMGVMIYDKRDGPFELHVSSIHAYQAPRPFTLSDYQWDKRVLVLSAASGEDAQLQSQLDDTAATREAFEARDLVLVVALDAGGSVAGDRQLNAEEAATVRTMLGIESPAFQLRLIGKDGSVKRVSDKPVAMASIYALIDTMPMRQREQDL